MVSAIAWSLWSPHRRAHEIGGYAAVLAWPVLRVMDLAAMPGRLREWERRYSALSSEAHELRRTVDTQNTFIDRLNDELRKTPPRVPVLPAETHAEFIEETSVLRIKSRVVGRQLTFCPDQRIDGQRLRLLIEDTAQQMGAALAEDITRDLEAFFAKRGGRHAA